MRVEANLLVGFPGETDADFLETVDFIKGLDVSYLHVFTYSERPNTEAINMTDVVARKLRNERSKMLRTLSEKKRRYFYEQFLGESLNVLFEKDIEGGKIHGFTDNYIRVAVDYAPEYINQILKVTAW